MNKTKNRCLKELLRSHGLVRTNVKAGASAWPGKWFASD
jgi:hypothetical protein